MEKDPKMQEITRAIVSMAAGLGLTSIAEGIETENDYQALKRMGCEYGQGYLFAKPLPIDDAISFLKENLKKGEDSAKCV